MNNDGLRIIVRGAYDIQKLRIQMGNRIVGNFKAKLGQEPSRPEEEMSAYAKKLLADLRKSYKKLTDATKSFPRQVTFKGDGVIDSYTELCLIRQYIGLEDSESEHFKRLGNILKGYAVYTEFLAGVKGIGPAMAGVIISEIDITKAKYPSSLWQYAGLGVEYDGRGTSKRSEHLKDVDYIDKEGEKKTRKGITFNPFLKTKLCGVLAPSFLRAGDNKYSDIYNDYKHRLECHEGHAEKTKGHRHNMAMRYMVKMFLIDLYNVWRVLEGLTVSQPYQEAKLGHAHDA